jgi:Trk-type K+ transport system membrane component
LSRRAVREQKKVEAAAPTIVPEGARYGGRAWPVLLLCYFALILLGYWWFRQSGVMIEGQDFSYDRAMFLSVNCVTLTGFQQSIGPNEFNPDSMQGPLIMLILTVAGSLLTMIVGGWAAARALRLRYSDTQIVIAAVVVELLAILAGSAALMGDGRRVGDAIQLAASAFGNSGEAILRPGGVGLPALTSWRLHCVLLPLSVLGGLGLPVLMELYDSLFGARRLSKHSQIVLSLTAGIYVCSVAALTFCMVQEGSSSAASVRDAMIKSSAVSLDARTAGLPLDLIKNIPLSQWLIILLMIIGASPAGTAAGVKATTFYVLFTGVRDVFRKQLPRKTFAVAATWLCAYLLIAFAGFLFLCATEPQISADRLLFMTFSAVSNVGLSHDPVSVVGPGLYVLDCLMIAGRITPLLVVWWLAMSGDETEVLVG